MAIKVLVGPYRPVSGLTWFTRCWGVWGGSSRCWSRDALAATRLKQWEDQEVWHYSWRGHFNCCVNFRGINVRCFSQWNTVSFPLAFHQSCSVNTRQATQQAWGERGVVVTVHWHFKHRIPGCAIYVELTLTDKRWKGILFLLNNHKVSY